MKVVHLVGGGGHFLLQREYKQDCAVSSVVKRARKWRILRYRLARIITDIQGRKCLDM